MAVTIDSPIDAATGTPNPLRAVGTSSGSDLVQVRLGRVDGTVFNGSTWVDDPTMFTPVANGGDSISALVDITTFGRFWQTGNERFVVEVEAIFTDSTTAAIQYLFSLYDTGAGTGKLFAVYVDGAGVPTLTIWDDTNTALFIASTNSAHVDGDLWKLRFSVNRANPKIEESIDGGAFTELALTTETLTANSNDWGYEPDTADLTAMQATFGNLYPTNTASELTGGSVLSAKVTAQTGSHIVDLDTTRDMDAGHLDADPIVAADGQVWTKSGGTIERIMSDSWFTALGLTDWVWDTPELTPIEHTIWARAVLVGAVNGTAEASFTPLAINLGDGSGGFYARRGTGKYRWAATIVDPKNPTYAEVAASVDLTCDVANFSGLSLNHDPVVVPTVVSPQDNTIPGVIAAQTPTLLMYDRMNDTSAFRNLLAVGAEGFLILEPYGTHEVGDRVTVIPTISAGNSDLWTVANEPARYVVSLAVSGRISETYVTF